MRRLGPSVVDPFLHGVDHADRTFGSADPHTSWSDTMLIDTPPSDVCDPDPAIELGLFPGEVPS